MLDKVDSKTNRQFALQSIGQPIREDMLSKQ